MSDTNEARETAELLDSEGSGLAVDTTCHLLERNGVLHAFGLKDRSSMAAHEN